MRGKQKCKILKEIRQRIADENDIPYVTRECSYQGECTGTCPRCESELKYLEQQLERRRVLGKRVSVAALCVGIALASAGCTTAVKPDPDSMQTDLTGEVAPPESDIVELSGEVDISDPSSEPDTTELSGEVDVSGPYSGPDTIELSGDVAWPDESCDSIVPEDIMIETTGEVAWPDA